MKKLKESRGETKFFNVMLEVFVDLEDLDEENGDKALAFLRDYFSSDKYYKTDLPGLDCEMEEDGYRVFLTFTGNAEFEFIPGEERTWDYPGSPAYIENPFEPEDAVYCVQKALEQLPDDIVTEKGEKVNSEAFIEKHVTLNDSDFPDEEDFMEEPYEGPEYHHSCEESVSQILQGVPVREVILNCSSDVADTEFALNVVDSDGKFLYQVDCFDTKDAAESAAKFLDMKSGEDFDIVCIEYDANGNELATRSVR